MSFIKNFIKVRYYPEGSLNLLDDLISMHENIHSYFKYKANLEVCYKTFFNMRLLFDHILSEVDRYLSNRKKFNLFKLVETNVFNFSFYNKTIKMRKNTKSIILSLTNYIETILNSFCFDQENAKRLIGLFPDEEMDSMIRNTICYLLLYKKLYKRFNFPSNSVKSISEYCNELELEDIKETISKIGNDYKNPFNKKEFGIPDVNRGSFFSVAYLMDYSIFDYFDMLVIDEIDKQFTKEKKIKKLDIVLEQDKVELDPLEKTIKNAVKSISENELRFLGRQIEKNIKFEYKVNLDQNVKLIIKMTLIDTNTEVFMVLNCTKVNKSTNVHPNRFSVNTLTYDNYGIKLNILTSSRLLLYDDIDNYLSLDDRGQMVREPRNDIYFNMKGTNLDYFATFSPISQTDVSIDDLRKRLWCILIDNINCVRMKFNNILNQEDYVLKRNLMYEINNLFLSRMGRISDVYSYSVYSSVQVSDKFINKQMKAYSESIKYPDMVLKYGENESEFFVFINCSIKQYDYLEFMFTTDKKLARLMNSRYKNKNGCFLSDKVINLLENHKSDKEFYEVFSIHNEFKDGTMFHDFDSTIEALAPEMKQDFEFKLETMLNNFINYLTIKK